MDYEINSETLAILPINKSESKIIEKNTQYIISNNTFEVIEHSCEYFGSSYLGRFNGTKNILNVTHKSPIIIEESTNLIFFPTTSPNNPNCIWISLNNILNYLPGNNHKTSIVEFNDGSKLEINTTIGILNNQILRATRLQMLFNQRREKIQK